MCHMLPLVIIIVKALVVLIHMSLMMTSFFILMLAFVIQVPTKPIIMTAELAGVPVQLEVDTGAGCSKVSKKFHFSMKK